MLFAEDVDLLAPSSRDLHREVERVHRVRVSFVRSEPMVLHLLLLGCGGRSLLQAEGFMCFGVFFHMGGFGEGWIGWCNVCSIAGTEKVFLVENIKL